MQEEGRVLYAGCLLVKLESTRLVVDWSCLSGSLDREWHSGVSMTILMFSYFLSIFLFILYLLMK